MHYPKKVRIRLPDLISSENLRGARLLIEPRTMGFTNSLILKLDQIFKRNSNLEIIIPYVRGTNEFQCLFQNCRKVIYGVKVAMMIESASVIKELEDLPHKSVSSFILGLGDLTSEVLKIPREDSFSFFGHSNLDTLIQKIRAIVTFCDQKNVEIQIGGLPTSFFGILETKYKIHPSGWLLRPDNNHSKFLHHENKETDL